MMKETEVAIGYFAWVGVDMQTSSDLVCGEQMTSRLRQGVASVQ